MDSDTVWRHIDSQRAWMADFLESLRAENWQRPSLCAGWTVRDVGAQLTFAQTPVRDLLWPALVESIPPARRVRLHARIGQALSEAIHPTPEQVVETARHLFLAVSVVGAAAALAAVLAAADDALSRLALGQAEQYLLDALALAAQLASPEERSAIDMEARSRLALTRIYAKGPAAIGEDTLLAAGVLSEAPLTLDRGDPTPWFAAMTTALAVGGYQRMVDEADRALAPDLSSAMEAMVRLESGLAHFGLGDLARARAELEATRQLVSNGGDFGALAFVLSGPAPLVILGVITHFEGDERGADALLAEALSMTDNALGMVLATFGNALLAAYRGDPAAASDHAKACVQIAADYPAYFAMGRMLDGWAAARQGDPEGVKGAEDAFAAYSVDGTLLWIPLFLVLRAEAHVCTGDPRGAQELVALARSVASRTGEDCLGPRLSALATEIERAAG